MATRRSIGRDGQVYYRSRSHVSKRRYYMRRFVSSTSARASGVDCIRDRARHWRSDRAHTSSANAREPTTSRRLVSNAGRHARLTLRSPIDMHALLVEAPTRRGLPANGGRMVLLRAGLPTVRSSVSFYPRGARAIATPRGATSDTVAALASLCVIASVCLQLATRTVYCLSRWPRRRC